MNDGDLHNRLIRRRSRGCLVLAAFSLLVMLVGCMLGIFGVRSGALAPLSASGRMGPVQLIAFVLCTSTRPANPCATGTRSYEVWLLVDWRRLGAGRPRSYPLLNMPLQE